MTIGWPESQPLVIAGSKGIENNESISGNNIQNYHIKISNRFYD